MQQKFLRKKGATPLPQRGREPQHDEYGQEQKGISRCPICRNVHFKKRWRHSLASIQTRANTAKGKRPVVSRAEICPACAMVKEGEFEGEIFLRGFPIHRKTELLRLVRNFGVRATERDPQDRIIAIENTKKGLRVTTTENQLANRLAKKIKSVFNSVELAFSRPGEPSEVSRVNATFLTRKMIKKIREDR